VHAFTNLLGSKKPVIIPGKALSILPKLRELAELPCTSTSTFLATIDTPMTHVLVRRLREALRDVANPARATQMQAYMKSALPFHGVAAPEQKRIWRRVFAEYPLDSFAEWQSVALALWRHAAFREERYAALALTDLSRYAPYRTFAAMSMFTEMIVDGAWWDYVDALATHQVGDVLRVDPERMKPLLRRWAEDSSMWKRRASILSQIRFKQDTDLDLLYACIEANLDDGEFFIRKAIGWALRQYAWTDPREVRRYVREQRARLNPLSVREALKNL
jgi:3-methyladenine DNA glycosylase AlkD